MRILIDIGHPAHVHLFKNFSWEMQKKGHRILFTARYKEYEINLLRYYGFDYISFGKKNSSILSKITGLFKYNSKLLFISLKFKPDIFISHGSIHASQVSFILRKPHISLEDSGNMEQVRLYKPFTKAILTPDILPEDLGKKQIRYSAYHELFYLHPKYFRPNKNIYKGLNISENEPYCIIRFVAWKATHDYGHKGLLLSEKINLINMISKKLKVFISSESHLPEQFIQYKINIPPEKMHDALAFASLYIGEGATMASESGILGTPAIYINTIRRSYCEDQERFDLVSNFSNGKGVIEKALEILSIPNYKENLKNNVNELLNEKINPTPFFVWFVENYPESVKTMKENPDYQYRFK